MIIDLCLNITKIICEFSKYIKYIYRVHFILDSIVEKNMPKTL